MYDILKEFSELQEWVFTYARQDFQNLFDEVEKKEIPHIFLDPVEIEDNENDSGVVESKIYSGSFMIVLSSDFDEENYEVRYQKYIKPILDEAVIKTKDFIRCGEDDVSFNLWKTIEVINSLDYNFDGVIVNYNLTIDE